MSGQRILPVAAVLAATVLVVLDASIVNVALPTLARDLGVGPGRSVLVVTAYQLALVMALLPCAALGESLGFRRVYLAGVGLFTGASILCALAPTLPWLIAARFIQGLGGAAVMALGMALLRHVAPSGALGAAIGWNATAVALAAAAGPSLGALIVSGAGWPWLFAVNLPVGAAVLWAGRTLPRIVGSRRRLDVISVALNAALFVGLVAGADLAPKHPWIAVALISVVIAALIMLIRREAPKAAPLVPLDLLSGYAFRISVIASVCCFVGQAAALVAVPFQLQHGFALTPVMAGLYMTAWPLAVALAAQAAGWLAARISTAWLCALGGALMSTGLAGLAVIPTVLGAPATAPLLALCGLGFGLFQTPNNRNMLMAAPLERSGAAGGMQGAARLTGQTTGGVLMSLLFTALPVTSAPRLGLALAACAALAAAVVSLLRAGPAYGGFAKIG